MSVKGWPTCARCLLPVHAYGIEHETPKTIDVWARCDGTRIRIQSGYVERNHPPMSGVQSVGKPEGVTMETLKSAIGLLVYFGDGGTPP